MGKYKTCVMSRTLAVLWIIIIFIQFNNVLTVFIRDKLK